MQGKSMFMEYAVTAWARRPNPGMLLLCALNKERATIYLLRGLFRCKGEYIFKYVDNGIKVKRNG